METLKEKGQGWGQAREQSARGDREEYSKEAQSQQWKHLNLEEDHKEETTPGPRAEPEQ